MGIKRKGLWLRRNDMSNKHRPRKIDDKYLRKRFNKSYQSSPTGTGDYAYYGEDRVEPFY